MEFVDLQAKEVSQKTQRESKPSLSALCAMCIRFPLVACWPACGNVIPTFKVVSIHIASSIKR